MPLLLSTFPSCDLSHRQLLPGRAQRGSKSSFSIALICTASRQIPAPASTHREPGKCDFHLTESVDQVVVQKSMSLKYEPSSEPLHISARIARDVRIQVVSPPRSLLSRLDLGGPLSSGCWSHCLGTMTTDLSSYTKVYSVIYDSGSVPEQSMFSPRETRGPESITG